MQLIATAILVLAVCVTQTSTGARVKVEMTKGIFDHDVPNGLLDRNDYSTEEEGARRRKVAVKNTKSATRSGKSVVKKKKRKTAPTERTTVTNRIGRDELQGKSISELRELARAKGVAAHLLDSADEDYKAAVINLILGRAEIMQDQSDLLTKMVAELKESARSKGFSEEAIEDEIDAPDKKEALKQLTMVVLRKKTKEARPLRAHVGFNLPSLEKPTYEGSDGILCPTKESYDKNIDAQCKCEDNADQLVQKADSNTKSDTCGPASFEGHPVLRPLKKIFNDFVVGPGFQSCCDKHDVDVGICPTAGDVKLGQVGTVFENGDRPRSKIAADDAFFQCMLDYCAERHRSSVLKAFCDIGADVMQGALADQGAVEAYSASIRENCECL